MENRFKFRVWNKKEKTMHYEAEKTYDFMTGKPVICEESFGELLEDKDYIVMQCIGIKDKNEKLIYEGDIVRLEGNDNPYMNNVIGVAKYSNRYAMFYINIPDNIAWYEFNEVEKKGLSVIGNIYENKELLNGNKNKI